MNRVLNKVALVTGAARGLGATACRLLSEEGAKVVVTDVDIKEAEQVAAGIVASGGDAIAIKHDVTCEDDWKEVLNTTVKQFGQLDILVNNAGGGGADGKVADCVDRTLKDWHKGIDINLTGAFLGIREAIEIMRKQSGTGSIINISSGWGVVGGGDVCYSAGKGGTLSLTRALAAEFGRLNYNIRVNNVVPGIIGDTRLGRIHEDDEKNLELQQDWVDRLVPMKRVGKAIEIAQGILFLASDDASYMNGSSLVIDGGHSAVNCLL